MESINNSLFQKFLHFVSLTKLYLKQRVTPELKSIFQIIISVYDIYVEDMMCDFQIYLPCK